MPVCKHCKDTKNFLFIMAWTSHKLIEYFFSLHFPEERPPFFAPFNAFRRLSTPHRLAGKQYIRCQEVFKGFGRRKLGFYQAHSRNKNPLHPSGFYALI